MVFYNNELFLAEHPAEVLHEHISSIAQCEVCVNDAQMVRVCWSTQIGSRFPVHAFSFSGLGSVPRV